MKSQKELSEYQNSADESQNFEASPNTNNIPNKVPEHSKAGPSKTADLECKKQK